jgi:UDP-glucose 4-epimerase
MGPLIMDELDLPIPTTLYGASKVMGEGIFRAIDREIGLSWNIARLFFIYGPRQYADGGYKSVILSNFERLMNNESPTIYGDGTQALDYVYIDDCIKALMSLASNPTDRQIVNISTGTPVTINELTQTMVLIARSKQDPAYLQADWTEGSVRFGSNSLAQERFRWNASTGLVEGLTKVYEWKLEETS